MKRFTTHLVETQLNEENCSCCDNKIDADGKCGCGPDCEHCGGQHDVDEGSCGTVNASKKTVKEDYTAGSEKSQFGGHRAQLKNKEGKTSYLGAKAYKKPEHAAGEAQAYHDHYFKGRGGNERAADKAVSDYRNKNKKHMNESQDLTEGKMKDFHDMVNKGMSAAEIAKKIKMPVKDVADFMKGMKKEEASKEGTVRIIDLGNKGQDKIRKELGVDKLPNKGFQVQVMTKGKFVNVSTPYKTMKDAEKVRKSGQHSLGLDEKYDLYHKTFSGAMQHSYEYSKKKFGIEIDPNEIDDKVATGPAKPKTGKTNSYRLKGKDGKKGIQVQVYNTGKSYELNMYKEEVELDEAAQILAHGGKGQYKVTKNGSNIEIKFKGKVVGTAEFDRGSDSFFVSIKGEKGQKSFDDAQAMADYFAKNKITEDTQLKEDVTMSMGWKTTENSFNQLMKALKTGSNLTKTINLTVKVDSHMRKIEKLLSKAYSHWEDIDQMVGMNLQDGVVDSSLEDRKERYERVMSHYRLKEEEEPEKPDSAKDVEKGRDDKKKTRIAQLQLQIAKATETINKINAQEK